MISNSTNAPNVKIRLALLLFVSILSYAIQLQHNLFSELGISGLFVPDSVSLLRSTHIFWDSPDQANPFQVLPHIFVLYLYRLSPLIGSLPTFFLNTLLYLSSFYVWHILILTQSSRFPSFRPAKASNYLFTIYLSPYFLMSLALPNKDIILLLFVSIYAFGVQSVSRRPFLAIFLFVLSIFPVLYIRDAFSVLLLCFLPLFYIVNLFHVRLTPRRILVLVIFAIPVISFFDYRHLSDVHFAFQRQAYIQEEELMGASDLVVSSYHVRFIGNLLNLALRPVFFNSDGNISLIYLGFFLLGALMLVGYLSTSFCLFSNSTFSTFQRFALLLPIFTIALISLAPYVQPRYLFPVLPLLSFSYGLIRARLLLPTICFSFIVFTTFYIVSPSSLPPPTFDVSPPTL